MQQHEVPTHLDVEDKAFVGLTMRQLLSAAVCVALAYATADQVPLTLPMRTAVAAVVLAGGALLTFWQPAGRPLDIWAFILLQYATTARVAVWRPVDQVNAPGDEADPPPVLVRLPTPSYALLAPQHVTRHSSRPDRNGTGLQHTTRRRNTNAR